MWAAFIRLCMQDVDCLHSQPQPATANLCSSCQEPSSYNPLCGWNYSTGPFSDSSIVSNRGAIDLLDTWESILSFPCTLSNLLRDRPALLMISRHSLHSLSAQVTPQWSPVIHTDTIHASAHTCKHHPCGPKDYSHVTIGIAMSSSTGTFKSKIISWIIALINVLWSMPRCCCCPFLFVFSHTGCHKQGVFPQPPLLLDFDLVFLPLTLCLLLYFPLPPGFPPEGCVSIGLKGEIIHVLHTSVWDLRNVLFVWNPEQCVLKIQIKHSAHISKIWRCLTLVTAYDVTVFFYCTPTHLTFAHSVEGEKNTILPSLTEPSLWQN